MTQTQILTKLKGLKKAVEQQIGRKLTWEQLLEAFDAQDLQRRLEPIKETLRKSSPGDSCLPFDGWTVRMSEDGYYRMYKTIEGKTESIYLGKKLDLVKARRKIATKEKKLGLLF